MIGFSNPPRGLIIAQNKTAFQCQENEKWYLSTLQTSNTVTLIPCHGKSVLLDQTTDNELCQPRARVMCCL